MDFTYSPTYSAESFPCFSRIFIIAEPTIAPSEMEAIFFACSGVDIGGTILHGNCGGGDCRRVGAELLGGGSARVNQLDRYLYTVAVYCFGDAAQISKIVVAGYIKGSEEVNAVDVVDRSGADGDDTNAALCLILDVSEKFGRYSAGWSGKAGYHGGELNKVLYLHVAYLYR